MYSICLFAIENAMLCLFHIRINEKVTIVVVQLSYSLLSRIADPMMRHTTQAIRARPKAMGISSNSMH